MEESSSSTIEAETPRRNKQHFEKEICTITRLNREDEVLLPSIGWRSHHHAEYHREKLVKARPQDYSRQCGTMRRMHEKRRYPSGRYLDRQSYNIFLYPFP